MNEWVDTECLRSKQRAEDNYQRSLWLDVWTSVVVSLWFIIAFAWEAGSGWPSGPLWSAMAAIGAVLWLDSLVDYLRKLGVPW